MNLHHTCTEEECSGFPCKMWNSPRRASYITRRLTETNPMTENKVQEMYNRITENNIILMEEIVSPRELAELLCEMEERMEAWNPAYGDKEADKEHMFEDGHKAGYLAALGEMRGGLEKLESPEDDVACDYGDHVCKEDVGSLLDDLKKKYE